MSIMLTGGCIKCNRTCSTGIDSYMLDGNKIITDGYPNEPGILCYACYNKHYSPEAVRDKKLENLIEPKYKRYIKKMFSPFVRYFEYIGIIRPE